MADSTVTVPDAVSAKAAAPRHSALVRITHWISAICAIALVVTGFEILVSHPRFYWGENGNPMMPSLFDIPIPASRPWVQTGYNFVLPDQNGWSRNLHFEAAWIIIATGLIYAIASLRNGHLRRNLLPARGSLGWGALSRDIVKHLRFGRPDPAEAQSYNTLQRISYVLVVYGLFPLAIWTGLAMSPAILSVCPFLATFVGGLQSARTLHFFASLALVLFLLVHIVMVVRAGFKSRMRAMIVSRHE